jgi:hypothetical protein
MCIVVDDITKQIPEDDARGAKYFESMGVA